MRKASGRRRQRAELVLNGRGDFQLVAVGVMVELVGPERADGFIPHAARRLSP